MDNPLSSASADSTIALTAQLSPAVLDFLRIREAELTRRREIAAQRDIEIQRIRSYAEIVIAAINGVKASREVLIRAFSEGIREAIAEGRDDVACELARSLASLGTLSNAISTGFAELTGSSIEQE